MNEQALLNGTYIDIFTICVICELCLSFHADVFWQNREDILSGLYKKSLINYLTGSALQAMKELKTISISNIYNDRSVMEIEIVGYKVLGGLPEEFVWAVLQQHSHYAKKLLKLLPQQVTYTGDDPYQKNQAVIDFVSGMTDLHAVKLYRKIKGITFPGLR